ncbi:MAG: aspartate aminotransferase family protein [Deltaproteobacteria bacterium]|nr:aspartate aminotransferase family protein [Deltaproteobacteria bacterium]
MTAPEQPYPSRAATFAAFGEHVSRGKTAMFEKYGVDVVMGERHGACFHDAYDGRRLFNCHSNGGVFNLGHRHPAVLAALRQALDTLDIGNHHLVSGMRARLAERLVATTKGRLPGVVFAVAGGEAIDLAIKVARAATKRRGVVSASGGYHGHTGLALAAGDAKYREPFFSSAAEFTQVPFNDVDALARVVNDGTAAVLLETIPATLGMPIPEPGYLKAVGVLCQTRGAKLILDEVQTGLGRTGTLWAHEADEVAPDAIVTGKGLSGGLYPIAATLLSRELHAVFDEDPFRHISTFGGAELGCAAALAVLDVVEAPAFLPRVCALGERFAHGLAGAPFELRRRGMFMGLKFPFEDAGLMGAKLLIDAGIFAVWANNDTSVVQFLPPLVCTDAEADEIVGIVRKVFG